MKRWQVDDKVEVVISGSKTPARVVRTLWQGDVQDVVLRIAVWSELGQRYIFSNHKGLVSASKVKQRFTVIPGFDPEESEF